jgi:putative transport protein
VLFIYAMGLQVGPGFFSTFKHGGVKLNLLALVYVLSGVAVMLCIYLIIGDRIEFPMMMGIMHGAVTDTPGLGAAVEALKVIGYNGMPIGLGYAVAYPVGILGLMFAIILLRFILRVDIDKENEEIRRRAAEDAVDLSRMSIRVTNSNLDGKTVAECVKLIGRKYVISRLFDNGNFIVPASGTVIHCDDVMLVVTAKADAKTVLAFLGKIDNSVEWKDEDATMVSRRIVVTRSEINGKSLSSLKLRNVFGVNITRVNRSGVDLVASPDLVLQVGDKVMVVGPLEAVKKAEKMLGDTLKRLRNPHIVSLFFGVFAGVIVGCMPVYLPGMPMPVRLGLAGGPLLVSILVGRFGYKAKLISYTTQSANLMLREIGLCFFLASLGIDAGGSFVPALTEGGGILWVGLAFFITVVPALVVGVLAYKLLKMNYSTVIGLLAGSSNSSSALAYATQAVGNDTPTVAYTTVYPLTMFLRIVAAQLLILLMM